MSSLHNFHMEIASVLFVTFSFILLWRRLNKQFSSSSRREKEWRKAFSGRQQMMFFYIEPRNGMGLLLVPVGLTVIIITKASRNISTFSSYGYKNSVVFKHLSTYIFMRGNWGRERAHLIHIPFSSPLLFTSRLSKCGQKFSGCYSHVDDATSPKADFIIAGAEYKFEWSNHSGRYTWPHYYVSTQYTYVRV